MARNSWQFCRLDERKAKLTAAWNHPSLVLISQGSHCTNFYKKWSFLRRFNYETKFVFACRASPNSMTEPKYSWIIVLLRIWSWSARIQNSISDFTYIHAKLLIQTILSHAKKKKKKHCMEWWIFASSISWSCMDSFLATFLNPWILIYLYAWKSCHEANADWMRKSSLLNSLLMFVSKDYAFCFYVILLYSTSS